MKLLSSISTILLFTVLAINANNIGEVDCGSGLDTEQCKELYARDPAISAQPFGSRSKAKVLRGLAPRHPEPAGGSGATAGTTGGAGGAGDAGGAGLQRSSSRLSQAPTEVERRPSTSLSQAETLVDDERHNDIFEPRPPKPVRFAYNTQ